jgi:nicotinamidase/pyrazinamidase
MRALIVVDMQKAFVDGELAVPHAAQILAPMQAMLDEEKFDIRIFTQDWHHPEHSSFKEFGGPWPKHCIPGTKGAEFCDEIDSDYADIIIRKGQNKAIDSYSAFMENDRKTETGLYGYLNSKRFYGSAHQIFICGLAKDFCVKWTAEDALLTGAKVYVIDQLTRSVFPDKDKELNEYLHSRGIVLI